MLYTEALTSNVNNHQTYNINIDTMCDTYILEAFELYSSLFVQCKQTMSIYVLESRFVVPVDIYFTF